MLARGGGTIVNMASMAAISGLKYTVSYGSSKGGLVHMTRVMALDYADKGITVNCVCPSPLEAEVSKGGLKLVPAVLPHAHKLPYYLLAAAPRRPRLCDPSSSSISEWACAWTLSARKC